MDRSCVTAIKEPFSGLRPLSFAGMLQQAADTIVMRCPICEQWKPVPEMRQLLPCLHLFCSTCMAKNSKKVCLMSNCFSSTFTDGIIMNNCDNVTCPRKLSSYESQRIGVCNHELCQNCLEEMTQSRPAVCPVEGCGELISETDSGYCDGCKKSLVNEDFVVTKCCSARYCKQCVEKKFGIKLASEIGDKEITCPEGQCTSKSPRKIKQKTAGFPIAHCLGSEDCTGIALNGFPSNGECEHDVCIKCLEKMIDECKANGSPPVCPNILCHQPYNVDSVIALRTLFPDRSEYFNSFALENQGYDVIKDETVSTFEMSSDFTVSSRRMEVKCELVGDDENYPKTVIFDRKGNVADFIREIRRALKILPLDKVYGFYIRQAQRNGDKKLYEELLVDAKSITRPISDLHLTAESVITVDTSGIMQLKASSSKKSVHQKSEHRSEQNTSFHSTR